MNNIEKKYGPWALITGASSGIGREIAVVLAGAGLDVVLVARREDKLKELSTFINKSWGGEAKIVVADLLQKNGIEFLLEETSSLDIGLLVNNVGREDSGCFLDILLDDALNTLDLNCRVPLVLTHHFAKKMKQRRNSGIVFMSSLVSYQGVPFVANYAGTKAYNLIIAESLAAEFKPFNIDVIAATPGFTNTELAKDWDFSGIPLKPLAAPYVAHCVISELGKKSVVIPGIINKVLYFMGKFLLTRKLNTFSFGIVFKRVLRKILI